MGGSNNSDKLICALSCVYFSLRIWAAVRLRLQASLHLRSHLAPYLVSERRSIAGYVTERTDKTWCKANAIRHV